MAGRLALIAGSAVREIELPRGDWELLQRHGQGDEYVLPHLIDHAANLGALVDAGCDRVLALGSVGTLRPRHVPGTFLCPDDFIAFGPVATTRADAEAHRVPGFDPVWRRRVMAAWRDAAGVELRDGGVYWQARGPRLETVAEIRLIAEHADVIGMTIGSECVIARELGLAYAAVCVVDNFANGVEGEEFTLERVLAGQARNHARLARSLRSLLPRLA